MVHAFLTDLGYLGQNEVAFALRTNDLAQPVSVSAAGTAQHAPQAAAPSKQRAAVCVTGVFRIGPFTWPSYEENVLVQLGMPYDVYVVTPKLDAFPDVTDHLYFMHPYKVVYPNYDKVGQLLALPGWEKTDFTAQHTPSKWLHQVTVSRGLPRGMGPAAAHVWLHGGCGLGAGRGTSCRWEIMAGSPRCALHNCRSMRSTPNALILLYSLTPRSLPIVHVVFRTGYVRVP